MNMSSSEVIGLGVVFFLAVLIFVISFIVGHFRS